MASFSHSLFFTCVETSPRLISRWAQKIIECHPRSPHSPRVLMEQPQGNHTQGRHKVRLQTPGICNLTLCSHTMQHSFDVGQDAALRNFRESPSLLTLHTPARVQLPQPKLTTARSFAHRPGRLGSGRLRANIDTFCSTDTLSILSCGHSLEFFYNG